MGATDDFIKTLTQTPISAGQLHDSLNTINSGFQDVINVLTYSKTVDDDLATLDDTLTTVIEGLDIAIVIPDVDAVAAPLRDAATALQEEVKPAHEAANSIEAEVKPVRDALQEAQTPLTDLMSAVQKIQTDSQTFLTDFTAVVACINGLPDGTYKSQGLTYLDTFSSAVQPEVAALNSAMDSANGVLSDLFTALQTLMSELNPLQQIASDIESVLNVLNPLLSPLNAIVNALQNTKIFIPIPYPMEVSLLQIFQDFGDFIGQAMDALGGLVNDLLSALDITLPQIPGLSDLINLQLNIPTLPDFPNLVASVEAAINALEARIPSFALNCPPTGDEQVPNGGIYQG